LFQSLLKRLGNAKMERKEKAMADNGHKKMGPPRISLGDSAAARRSLARIIRLRFRKEIDNELFRDLCYGLNILLAYDKFEKESQLETKNGRLVLNVTQAEMDGLDDVTRLSPCERDERITELLQKMGCEEKAAEPEPPQADIPPVPELVPTISDAPEQPQSQPRRLKL
jgi:hypothetical protein